MSAPDIGGLLSGGGLSALLQNPEVAAKLPRIMEALAPLMAEMQAENAAKTAAPAAPEGEKSAAGSLADLLSGVNAGSPQPSDAAAGPAAQNTAQNEATTAAGDGSASALAPIASKMRGFRSDSARRGALLKALSPYLSENRRQTLDYIVKVSALIDLLSDVL